MYDTKERRWLIEIVLRWFVTDCLDTLEYYPANSDGEFSLNEYEKTVESLLDALVEEQPDQVFMYIKEWLKNNNN